MSSSLRKLLAVWSCPEIVVHWWCRSWWEKVEKQMIIDVLFLYQYWEFWVGKLRVGYSVMLTNHMAESTNLIWQRSKTEQSNVWMQVCRNLATLSLLISLLKTENKLNSSDCWNYRVWQRNSDLKTKMSYGGHKTLSKQPNYDGVTFSVDVPALLLRHRS